MFCLRKQRFCSTIVLLSFKTQKTPKSSRAVWSDEARGESKPTHYLWTSPPVLSLSLCDRPVCLRNNELFNWILFRGNSNADPVIRETLKIYVCLILWICVCCVIQQCTGAKPNHLKRKKNALFNIYNPFWTVNSICSLKWWLVQSIILILFYAA